MTLKNHYYTVEEAAEVIGCSPGRVRQLIGEGRLEGERAGDKQTSAWLLFRKSVDQFAKLERPTGRPRLGF